jgi:pyridinium-3,5-biscarboxylic acid mononucleotide sulfurtransferase
MTTLDAVLAAIPDRTIACSGGVDSMLLATVAHRADPDATLVAHDVTPAVPSAATARVVAHAATEGWSLRLVRSGEFEDEAYLSNPVNRCFHCKHHLYQTLARLGSDGDRGRTLLSGANLDDLGEYRPGLNAAAQRGVRHPFIEAGMSKAVIRRTARALGLDFAELPASPCLASRLYTGTRVTAARLKAVDIGEELLRALTGVEVVRCRIRADAVLIELQADDRDRITPEAIARVGTAMRAIEPSLSAVALDDTPYRPGRAFAVAR